MESTSTAAIAAYRHLLRATRIAFKGDNHLLHAARMQARGGFDKGRSLQAASDEAVKAVAHAEEVGKILINNIVQGKRVEGSEDMYRLNIHEQTERGDNDTVKNPLQNNSTLKVFKKCS